MNYKTLLESLETILKTGKFSDVIFRVGIEEEEFHGHKLILSMNSMYWKRMFYGASWKEVSGKKIAEIYVPNISPEIFQIILTYVYTHKINMDSFEQAIAVLEAADFLLISDLKEECSQIFSNSLNQENCFSLLSISLTYNIDSLKKKIFKFIEFEKDIFLKNDALLGLSPLVVQTVLHLENLLVPEIQLFRVFLFWWINFSEKSDLKLNQFIESFQFNIMNVNELKEVQRSNIVSEFLIKKLEEDFLNDSKKKLWENKSRRTSKIIPMEEIKVLVLAADDRQSFRNDVFESVKSQGITEAKLIDARTELPTLEEMMEYQVIFTYSRFSQYQNPELLGNLLSEYVEKGGNLVICCRNSLRTDDSYYIKGKILTNDTLPLTTGTNITFSPGKLAQKNLDHPLLQNVKTFDGGSGSYRVKVSVTQNSKCVAFWNDNLPMIAYKRKFPHFGMIVALNLFPVSDAIGTTCWRRNTDGNIIISNAVYFAVNAFYLSQDDF
ncbi:btb/poz domain-containing [Anaeramoeba ignava]|uniref:Btb/poz domain-containing n=1 Tax=Anaeramoeba ignava TaxID=1746090 RepID=A0A9Q0L9K2_ANAIG|nr:btb/poz domain-containing [Anaeramoeba ignava]